MDAQMEKDYIKGGAFLISEGTTADCFTPEDFTDEHKMIGDTCREYIDNEVVPQLPALARSVGNKRQGVLFSLVTFF